MEYRFDTVLFFPTKHETQNFYSEGNNFERGQVRGQIKKAGDIVLPPLPPPQKASGAKQGAVGATSPALYP